MVTAVFEQFDEQHQVHSMFGYTQICIVALWPTLSWASTEV